MHEMSIAQSLVSILQEEMAKHGAATLRSVRLSIGEMSAIVPESLHMAYQMPSLCGESPGVSHVDCKADSCRPGMMSGGEQSIVLRLQCGMCRGELRETPLEASCKLGNAGVGWRGALEPASRGVHKGPLRPADRQDPQHHPGHPLVIEAQAANACRACHGPAGALSLDLPCTEKANNTSPRAAAAPMAAQAHMGNAAPSAVTKEVSGDHSDQVPCWSWYRTLQ